MADGEQQQQQQENNSDEWHPTTRKDYEDVFAGGLIRAEELRQAKEREENERNKPDAPPRPARRNFLGGGSK